MLIEHLENWNPWWASNKVPPVLKGCKIRINSFIFDTLSEREILAIIGIRRCGKTTIMYQMIDKLLNSLKPTQVLYVNLDDEILKKETLESIYGAYRQHKNPEEKAFVFLDEIQNMVEWERFLKKHYDLRDNVKFVVSGSCTSLLKGEYSALLTGRNLTFRVFPLSFREYLDFGKISYNAINTTAKNKILHQLNEFFETGGFPEVYFKEKELKHILLKNYFDDIIYKDIVRRHNINAKKITDLAVYLLTNISNLFTIRKIRNSTGLSIDSIKDYISYLEDAYLVKTINHFSYSIKESSQMPCKSCTLDLGLRNIASFKFSKDIGRLAENLVFIELDRQEKEAYYWKGKGEVDFIVKNKDYSLTAINVTYSDKIDEREINSLLEFKKEFKKAKKLILLTKDLEQRKDGINFIPLWKWLLL